MRLLCLYFPRLGVEIALRQSPHLDGRSVALLSQPGPDGHLTAVSAHAADRGLLPGMNAGEARRKDPTCVFLPDNTGAALDELERIASIIRLRATPLVEVGGAAHLFVDLASTTRLYPDEAAAARCLQQLAQAWSGLPVRAGAGSTRRLALAAAVAARLQPAIDDSVAAAADEPAIGPLAERTLAVAITLPGGSSEAEARERLGGALRRLQTILDARNEAFRALRVEIECGEGIASVTAEHYPNPECDTGIALAHAGSHICLGRPSPAHTIRLTFGRLCPDVGAGPLPSRAPGAVAVAAPFAGTRPRFQQMLLRAAG